MEMMKEYKLSPEAMVMVAGSSIGTQKKFYERGFWYKQNNIGYEGTAEYLASKVLACSNVNDYVDYERCKINGRDGCRSANFLSQGESFISLQRLYDTYHGGQLSERIRMYDIVKDRIEFVIDFTQQKTGLDIRQQLGKIMTFDMLMLNTDRHFNNIGIVADVSKDLYKNAPIFDNGNALLSNISEFGFDKSIEKNIEKVVGQPFSASLERQALELGFELKINYSELFKLLSVEPDSRALETLQYQLKKYEKLIRDDTLLIHKYTFNESKYSVIEKLQDNKTVISNSEEDKNKLEKYRIQERER